MASAKLSAAFPAAAGWRARLPLPPHHPNSQIRTWANLQGDGDLTVAVALVGLLPKGELSVLASHTPPSTKKGQGRSRLLMPKNCDMAAVKRSMSLVTLLRQVRRICRARGVRSPNQGALAQSAQALKPLVSDSWLTDRRQDIRPRLGSLACPP